MIESMEIFVQNLAELNSQIEDIFEKRARAKDPHPVPFKMQMNRETCLFVCDRPYTEGLRYFFVAGVVKIEAENSLPLGTIKLIFKSKMMETNSIVRLVDGKPEISKEIPRVGKYQKGNIYVAGYYKDGGCHFMFVAGNEISLNSNFQAQAIAMLKMNNKEPEIGTLWNILDHKYECHISADLEYIREATEEEKEVMEFLLRRNGLTIDKENGKVRRDIFRPTVGNPYYFLVKGISEELEVFSKVPSSGDLALRNDILNAFRSEEEANQVRVFINKFLEIYKSPGRRIEEIRSGEAGYYIEFYNNKFVTFTVTNPEKINQLMFIFRNKERAEQVADLLNSLLKFF